LDSHFISGLILNKYYQDPGIRVSRYSLKGEKNHHAYYNRLGFIRVYAKDFTPAHLDPEQIFEKIKKLVFKIKNKYPNVLIFNVSVKPSLERINELDKIKKINYLLKNKSSEINGFTQIDVYESLLKDGEVNKDLLLQDGLHFNEEGYKVLKHHIELALKKQQLIA